MKKDRGSPLLSGVCPVCGNASLSRFQGGMRWHSPTHRCSVCHSQFRTKFTRASLLVIPITVLALGVSYVIITFVKTRFGVHGILFGTVVGGLLGGCAGLSRKIALKTYALEQVHGPT